MENKTILNARENLIRELDKNINNEKWLDAMSENFYNLDLTMYANDNLKNIIFKAFSLSQLNKNQELFLHPEQQRMLEHIINNDACILSAPTSFGKTFVVFEYLARYLPNIVMLIVPTLALADEYKKKILKEYDNCFSEYKLFQTYNKELDYSKYNKIIFILTHDKIVDVAKNSIDIVDIDFLCIDEVYKLSNNSMEDRTLVLNFAYYYLALKAKKYVLLAPFICNVKNKDKLPLSPQFYHTSFSPVINDIEICDIINDNLNERLNKAINILETRINESDKTMIYIPNVGDIKKFVDRINDNEFEISNELAINFIQWLKEEIHPEWYLVKAMENGFLIHNGQLSIGIRKIQTYLFNNSNYNRILCNSSLLEGINSAAKNIIITSPSRIFNQNSPMPFSSFDFYNLVGRTGRLFKNFIGYAFYIKSATDPMFDKEDAYTEIEFEITKNDKDIQLIKEDLFVTEDFLNFIKTLNIDKQTYLENIGYRYFNNVKLNYQSYQQIKQELLKLLDKYNKDNSLVSTAQIVQKILYVQNASITNKGIFYLYSSLIADLINKKRLSIKTIITNTRYQKYNLDLLINTCLKFKYGYIENDFYKTANLIKFFMECEHINEKLIYAFSIIIIDKIDYIYYKGIPIAKELYELGIYSKDIEIILNSLTEEDLTLDTKSLLNIIKNKNFNNISYLSKFIINHG